jgi:hypothetical protein
MKKIMIYLNLVFASLMLFSCSQDTEVYSCDKEVNAWVKENLSDIQEMNREKFMKYNEKTQRAIFAAMSSKQKQDLWLTKLNDILALDWENKEKEHLNELYVFIKTNETVFESSTNENIEDKNDIFLYKWIEYAKEQFGWDNTTLYNIGGTHKTAYLVKKDSRIQLLSENNEDVIEDTPRLKSSTELPYDPNQDCSCNKIEDFCGNNNSSSLAGSFIHKCTGACQNPTTSGCGWFWNEPCNGGCVATFVSMF